MKNRKDFLRSVSQSVTQSPQPLPGIPLIEICGCRRVLVENHQGVIAYDENEIQIRVRYGVIRISGQTLQLCRMCREQLVIMGQIDGVSLKRSS